MWQTYNEKQKRQMSEGIELPNQKRMRIFGEKETHKYIEILEVNTVKPAEIKEKQLEKTNEDAIQS